jgi:hypothetical protein
MSVLYRMIWQYGLIDGLRGPTGDYYRRNRFTGAVQFVIWKAGEQGHAKDFWINADDYWLPKFQPAK